MEDEEDDDEVEGIVMVDWGGEAFLRWYEVADHHGKTEFQEREGGTRTRHAGVRALACWTINRVAGSRGWDSCYYLHLARCFKMASWVVWVFQPQQLVYIFKTGGRHIICMGMGKQLL